MVCYFCMHKSWSLTGTATRNCKNIFFEIQIRSSCSKVRLIFNHFQLHAPQIIFYSVVKRKKGWDPAAVWSNFLANCWGEMNKPPGHGGAFRQSSLAPCLQSSAFLSPRVPQSSSPLLGDTGGLSRGWAVTTTSPKEHQGGRGSTHSSERVLTPLEQHWAEGREKSTESRSLAHLAHPAASVRQELTQPRAAPAPRPCSCHKQRRSQNIFIIVFETIQTISAFFFFPHCILLKRWVWQLKLFSQVA